MTQECKQEHGNHVVHAGMCCIVTDSSQPSIYMYTWWWWGEKLCTCSHRILGTI